MNRWIALPAIAVAFAMFGGSAYATTTTWTAEYDAAGYYGAVHCTGRTIVNKKYTGGKDVEVCFADSGHLENMKPGADQTAFETSGGGFVTEWESDSGSGLRTTDFSYSVNKAVTRFKLVAFY